MIRNYQPEDCEEIAEIFPRAVHEIAVKHYSPAQCNAWSGKRPNLEHWKARCEQKQPLVYETDGRVVGFLELDDDGHIDCLYVHPEHARQGIASQLIEHAIRTCQKAGIDRMFVEASLCARPVFEQQGFHVVEQRMVEIGGESLVNFEMALQLKK